MFRRLIPLLIAMILLGTACTSRPQVTLEPSAEAIVWQRSGGIAGICQQLTIYGDRRYEIEDCASGARLATGELPEAEWVELRSYLVEYSAFEYNLVPPEGSADMFTDSYTFNGAGSRTPSETVKAQINEFLASLATQLINA
ncbi:MAG TPA: hypothetical protein VJ436_08415 [Anaerolineales bacterium]|nr:hypothetical protein [Anaerolineales bacterium]